MPHPGGGLVIIHNTDGRYTTPELINNRIYMSVIDLPGDPLPPKLVEHKVEAVKEPPPEVVEEKQAVARMRKHRIETGGKKYQLLRGEFHRHTEVSWDGAPDGSLEDMFRYAIDAVAFDWIGNGDHDNGGGREYPWWLTQKFTDAYHVPGVFTPMFSYERSVAYPHGHRNVMFAKRGILTLPRALAARRGEKLVGGVHADDTKMLYRYLRELNGICASHTSATGMGTDWRDNDPAVEPIVEIYQGDRMSYEHEGAPRAGYDKDAGKAPVNIAGWYPKGFINHALNKGYKLGFQASSDHWSTHISFFVILAEKNNRKALLDAVKQRHCYGATDNILVDFRCGDRIMGDEITVDKAPTFSLYVHGTAALSAVEILRDSEVIAKLPAKGLEFKGAWTDPQPQAGHALLLRAPDHAGRRRIGVGLADLGDAEVGGRFGQPFPLCENVLNYLAGHVGEPEVTALESVGEPGVVDAEQVQNRRLEIVRVDWVLRDVVAEVVGRAVGHAAADAAAAHPDREAPAMVVAAEARLGEVALHEHGSAELAAPDH